MFCVVLVTHRRKYAIDLSAAVLLIWSTKSTHRLTKYVHVVLQHESHKYPLKYYLLIIELDDGGV